MIKTVWIDSHSASGQDHIVDGARLASDTERVLNDLESRGFEIVSLTPVVSGRYGAEKYDGRVTPGVFSKPTVAPDTCASWGYSMTDGFVVVARKKSS